MNTNTHIHELLFSLLEKSGLHIICESTQGVPFLANLPNHQNIFILPCCDDTLINTAMGMAISGTPVIVVLSTDQSLASIQALLEEETYGPEFTLPLLIVVPTEKAILHTHSTHIVYCKTGEQLYAHIKEKSVRPAINIVCYHHSALFDLLSHDIHQISAQTASKYSEGTHITLLTTGTDIETAKGFAEENSDIELIELISVHPFCTQTIADSVQKTGRVLMLNTPIQLTNHILDTCFWHLEAQPEYTNDSNHQNLSRLRARLLET